MGQVSEADRDAARGARRRSCGRVFGTDAGSSGRRRLREEDEGEAPPLDTLVPRSPRPVGPPPGPLSGAHGPRAAALPPAGAEPWDLSPRRTGRVNPPHRPLQALTGASCPAPQAWGESHAGAAAERGRSSCANRQQCPAFPASTGHSRYYVFGVTVETVKSGFCLKVMHQIH